MTAPTPITTRAASVSQRRVELMEMAVELAVDKNDFCFDSRQEEVVWDELQTEFDVRAERLGLTWLAETN